MCSDHREPDALIPHSIIYPVLLILLFSVLCGCRSGKTPPTSTAPIKTSTVIKNDTLPLPKGFSFNEVFTTSSSSLVIKAASGVDRRSLYSWQPGKAAQLIAEGQDLDIARLSDDTFATWYSENGQQLFATLDAQQLTSQPLVLPKGGPTGWGGCEGDTQIVVCTGNRPEMTSDDKDYDEMGFDAVLVIDLLQRKTSSFPVKDQTTFRFDAKRKVILVSDFLSASSKSRVESFDLAGKERGTVHLSDLTLSPSGNFFESVQEDGSEFWEIRDAKSNKVLLSFNCDKPGCNVGDRDDAHHRNPVFDGQLVALQDPGNPYGKGSTCDIYQSSPPRLLKRVPCNGLHPYDWSRNGRELITVDDNAGTFHRESIN